MVRKLTLNADREVIARAKRVASERHTSVAALFDEFVRSLGKKTADRRGVGRLTRKATGVIKLRRGQKEKRLLEKALLERHGMDV